MKLSNKLYIASKENCKDMPDVNSNKNIISAADDNVIPKNTVNEKIIDSFSNTTFL